MSEQRRVLTGITTSGTPHLGNYVGAIRPAIAASRSADVESYYFLADYHALVKCQAPERVQQSTREIAASWLACGLDPAQVYFYRQSDIPEIPELTWLLTCVTAKGLLNRAHAYKAATDANREAGDDPDAGISAGLYMYPVLMAADILMFNAHRVPVGRDQIQHIEMARDIGQRFNHLFGAGREYFTLPEAAIEEHVATLPGLDGRKMSKSYNNTIPLWLPAPAMRKAILGIVTNSLAPGEPKDADSSNLFAIFRAFADPEETQALRHAFAGGIAWGEAKQRVFERIEQELAPLRERYDALIARPDRLEEILQEGARRARAKAQPFLAALRDAVGLRRLTQVVRRSESDSCFAEAMDRLQPVPVAMPASVSNPYRLDTGDDPPKYQFNIEYANRSGTMLSKHFDSPREAGIAAKRVKSAPIEAFEPKTRLRDDNRYEVLLMLDGHLAATGNGHDRQEDADADVERVWQSLRASRPAP